MPLALSVLDLVPVADGASAAQALQSSLELARLVDELGYRRLWYAEHHNMPAIASTTPATLVALAAGCTRRIRVGSGGVMLPNHAPLQVAESFKMLEALYPGRIDLGIGRAPGTDPAATIALRGSRAALLVDDFPERLSALFDFGAPPAERTAQRSVSAYPEDVPLPPVWLLGSSDYSAALAAKLGLGFAFAAHFSPDPPDRPLLAYRAQFQPSARLSAPHAIIALSVVCADSETEAERLASSMQLGWVRLRSGRPSKLPSPEQAAAHPWNEAERGLAAAYRQLQVVGTPETVRHRIETLVQRTQADEVMVTTVVHDPAARLESYRLLAGAFAR
ncbi:MAG TPA: LLM class flavin-dependent oxidoreductase [Polyangiaceae bacterium]